ncbi:Voltage-dependent calcium channel subunit alpha-2/delta-1 [Anabarilius grahami]|uniref:Voltage-dependent calcium channel subunit alpha-2/delta-1 n=1 Tax=Anabarilius grahami TaxID=495550 RepID=A0A3N0XDN7_ANAGA|nr:Voltage-dependent calcium channel subunit alpha-2/delta-1 [Anabarilius grahami]
MISCSDSSHQKGLERGIDLATRKWAEQMQEELVQLIDAESGIQKLKEIFLQLQRHYVVKQNNAQQLVAKAAREIENLLANRSKALEYGYKNPVVRIQYAHTLLMTKFASLALYADPRVCVKSKLYFGLYNYNDNGTEKRYRWDHFQKDFIQLMNDEHRQPIRIHPAVTNSSI